jgi:hypothetical protein
MLKVTVVFEEDDYYGYNLDRIVKRLNVESIESVVKYIDGILDLDREFGPDEYDDRTPMSLVDVYGDVTLEDIRAYEKKQDSLVDAAKATSRTFLDREMPYLMVA